MNDKAYDLFRTIYPGCTRTIVQHGPNSLYVSMRGKTEAMIYVVPGKPPMSAIADTLEEAVAQLKERADAHIQLAM